MSGTVAVWKAAPRRSTRRFEFSGLFLLLIVAMIAPLFAIEPAASFPYPAEDWLSLLSFLCVGAYGFAALYFAAYARPFSLDCAHWVFVVFFLFYAPLVQFLTNRPPAQTDLGGFAPRHLEANALLLAWCAVYSLGRRLGWRTAGRAPSAAASSGRSLNMTLLAGLAVGATVVVAATTGWAALLSRGATAFEGAGDPAARPLALVVEIGCRAVPPVVVALLVLSGRVRTGAFWACLGVAVLCLIVTHSPFGVARFWFGTIAIGLVCLALRRSRRTALWLPYSVFVGFIALLPLLNLGRYAALSDIRLGEYRQHDFVSIVTGGDFDAYSMLVNTITYVQEGDGATMGRQLLGNALFFVPRSRWPGKADGSGKLIGGHYHLSLVNLSEPLPAEGLVNFGIPGLLLYAVLFGAALGRLDRAYWSRADLPDGGSPALLSIVYPFLVGFVIFMMRGDFCNSFAYACGFTAAAWLLLRVARLSA